MELAYGVGYLLLLALIALIGLPIVWVCEKIAGPSPDRTTGIYTIIGLAVVGAVIFG